jgi:peptide/nickel transport system substrate-binding protein
MPAERGYRTRRIVDTGRGRGLSRRGLLHLAGVGLAGGTAAALLAACRGEKRSTTGQQQQAGATAPTAAQPEPLWFATQVDMTNIDPGGGNDGAALDVQRISYDTLYVYDKNPAELVPLLAASLENPDAQTFIFKLRREAKFWDGSPVTAEAVKFSFDRLHRTKKGNAWFFQTISKPETLTTPDQFTLQFKLERPFVPFLHGMPILHVLNPAVVKQNDKGDDAADWLREHTAGSGAFRIKRWEHGQIYEFEALPDYWAGYPKEGRLASYARRVVREPSTRKILLEQGEVDVIDWVAPQDVVLLQKNPDVTVPLVPSMSVYDVKLNNKLEPTSNVNVRRAILYATDYDAIVKLAFNGLAQRLEGALSPVVPGAPKGVPKFETDLNRARAELQRSPWPNGGFELDFVYVQGLEEERITGEILQAQLDKLNIKVKITAVLWADAVARLQKPESTPHMFPIYSLTGYPDPDSVLWQSYHSSQAGFWGAASWYQSKEMDDLLEKGRQTVDANARTPIYRQITEILFRDAVEIFGVSRYGGSIRRKWVQGVLDNGVGSPGWRTVWIAGRPRRSP